MPTYSYKCKKCGNVFDVFHSISATPRIKCEECGGAAKQLMGTGAGIIFKGSGFYETDYKRSKGGGASSSGGSSESKSDTKTSDSSSKSSGGSKSSKD